MGYRSEIGICLKKEDYITLMKKAEKENKEAYNLITKPDEFRYNELNDNEYITLYWRWIKDYTDDMNWIQKNLLEYEHHYCRAGESSAELDGENYYNSEEPLYELCEAIATITLTGKKIKLKDII